MFESAGQVHAAPCELLVLGRTATVRMAGSMIPCVPAWSLALKSAVDFGHLVNERHTERVEKLIKTCGGEVVHGGAEAGHRAQLQPRLHALLILGLHEPVTIHQATLKEQPQFVAWTRSMSRCLPCRAFVIASASFLQPLSSSPSWMLQS